MPNRNRPYDIRIRTVTQTPVYQIGTRAPIWYDNQRDRLRASTV